MEPYDEIVIEQINAISNFSQILNLGFVAVIIALIIAVITLAIITKRLPKPVSPASASVSGLSEAVSKAAPVQDQGQVVAAITAALTAYLASEDGASTGKPEAGGSIGNRFVVHSVRRVGTRSAWSSAGRREQMM